MESELISRWRQTCEEVQDAVRACGRKSEEVRLIAVSKFHPLEAIRILARVGQIDFGENYLQEAEEKIAADLQNIRWHFIGHLQSNKANAAAGKFALIHGIDSVKLARKLHLRCESLGVCQPVLVQVNVAKEERKNGIFEEDLPYFLEQLQEFSALRVDGLMLMPPIQPEAEKSRPYFARLRELKEENERRFGVSFPQLSMGMTSDFAVAIAEGATLVRIGTKIFGSRFVRETEK